jgi:hypothetical protein
VDQSKRLRGPDHQYGPSITTTTYYSSQSIISLHTAPLILPKGPEALHALLHAASLALPEGPEALYTFLCAASLSLPKDREALQAFHYGYSRSFVGSHACTLISHIHTWGHIMKGRAVAPCAVMGH